MIAKAGLNQCRSHDLVVELAAHSVAQRKLPFDFGTAFGGAEKRCHLILA